MPRRLVVARAVQLGDVFLINPLYSQHLLRHTTQDKVTGIHLGLARIACLASTTLLLVSAINQLPLLSRFPAHFSLTLPSSELED